MERTTWTDERLDDAITRIDQRFDGVDRRLDALEHRMERFEDRVTSEFGALHRLIAQIGWALAGVMTAQAIALVIAAGS